mgnify:FL=1|tara:strand:+ start:1017 stop:1484 length:468 start_codon:yes stop_codon:yes gene_type:complete
MALNIYSGSQGIVYMNNIAVASIRSFSLEETQEVIDATTMNTGGVAFRTNKATFKSWSGSIDVFWTVNENSGANADESSGAGSTGDADLTPGTSEVEIVFWPAGDSQYELGYRGKCLITSRSISSSVDGMVEATVSVTGTTALAQDFGTSSYNGQ